MIAAAHIEQVAQRPEQRVAIHDEHDTARLNARARLGDMQPALYRLLMLQELLGGQRPQGAAAASYRQALREISEALGVSVVGVGR